MRYVVSAAGSSGDVHPLVGVGHALHLRGHEVTVIAAEPFRHVVEKAELGFISGWSTEEYEELTHDPDLWHPTRGMSLVFRTMRAHLRTAYEMLLDACEPGKTVLLGGSLALANRVFEDKHGLPAATLHLAPSLFRSDRGPLITPQGQDLLGAPVWVRRTMWRFIDHFILDRSILPALNELRSELDLAPVHRIFRSWIHAPRLTLGLFPDWFGSPQEDWPPQLELTGFPLYDLEGANTLDPGLEAFLAGGEPPIVGTPGSANRQASAFFEALIAASEALGRRVVLLTRYPEQLPDPLPPHARHEPYVPLSLLLPRAAAIAHHGGIGTSAQGLAAGVPQLLMPMGFDQPDNAARLERLGVARVIRPRSFTAEAVGAALRTLLGDPGVKDACSRLGQAIAQSDTMERTCILLEDLAEERHPS